MRAALLNSCLGSFVTCLDGIFRKRVETVRVPVGDGIEREHVDARTSRRHPRRRATARVLGPALLAVPAVLTCGPFGASAVAAPARTVSAAAEGADAELLAYHAAGYDDVVDAARLQRYWDLGSVDDATARAGSKLLAGGEELLPYLPSSRDDEVSARFLAAGYDHDDAVVLARMWGARVASADDAALLTGKELLDGGTPAYSPTDTPATAGAEATSAAYFNDGHDSDDLLALAYLWQKSVTETKTAAGRRVLAGEDVPDTASDVAGYVTGLDDKCLGAAGGATSDGTAVDLYGCVGTATQIWSFPGDGTFRIGGKCLDASGAGTADGTTVQLWTCNGTVAQQWIRTAGDDIVNPHADKCLDLTGRSSADYTTTQLWTCTGGSNQKWVLPDRVQVS